MPRFRLGSLFLFSATALLPGCATQDGGGSGFSLLPKSLQKAPATHMTVITEMTDAGRTVPAPTAESAAYYAIQSIDYHNEGTEYGRNKAMPLPAVEGLLRRALADSHYLPADSSHPAELVMVLICGSANTIDNRINPGFATGNGTPSQSLPSIAFPNGVSTNPGNADTGADVPQPPEDVMGVNDIATRQNFLLRARLVGGDKFSDAVANVLLQQDQFLRTGSGVAAMQPLELFESSDPTVRLLVEQTKGDRYYVVASVYGAGRLTHGQPKLLWRTKMTASSEGVTMAETFPALVNGARSFFGRDMSHAVILPELLPRNGHPALAAQ